MNILIIDSGAREHAIAKAIQRSSQPHQLFCLGSSLNPGIKKLCADYAVGNITDVAWVREKALAWNIDFTIVGPESPLAAGVVDDLRQNNIACVGPSQQLAQIETSKGFARDLLVEYGIQVYPKFKRCRDMETASAFLNELGEGNYVVKADGLVGGKGVKVAGDHLQNMKEALEYCQELVAEKSSFVLEEKLIGEEFSLMSFCDGEHVVHMPAVQDHKRAFEGDKGPNTGGMGSYSDSNHALPFLTDQDTSFAQQTNEQVAKALKDKFGEGYQGILYGGFMATKDGVKLIEYNARFGDPECMNVLAVLNTDFIEICRGIVEKNLASVHVEFASLATVCKYAVPEGYPDEPVKNQKIDISEVSEEMLFLRSVEEREDGLYEMGSRTAAVLALAPTIAEAEQKAEAEIQKIKGPLFHRRDIGTPDMIRQKVEMMKQLRGK